MMLYPISMLSLVLLALIHVTHGHDEKHTLAQHTPSISPIPFETRAYWMRKAVSALAELYSPCPFESFGTVIVNHTDTSSDRRGTLVCMSVNQNVQSGNPTLHGEIAGITNCSKVLTDPNGPYKLSPSETLQAFSSLSLYTNAEACPMCASAIRWSGFAEYIYGTSIDTLFKKGWGQISISSAEVFEESSRLPGRTVLIADILANETDPYFSWQFDRSYPCPSGCARPYEGENCAPTIESIIHREL